MNELTIKRARGGYVIEAEEALPLIARDLTEVLMITADLLEGDAYTPARVGRTIILTSAEDNSGQ